MSSSVAWLFIRAALVARYRCKLVDLFIVKEFVLSTRREYSNLKVLEKMKFSSMGKRNSTSGSWMEKKPNITIQVVKLLDGNFSDFNIFFFEDWRSEDLRKSNTCTAPYLMTSNSNSAQPQTKPFTSRPGWFPSSIPPLFPDQPSPRSWSGRIISFVLWHCVRGNILYLTFTSEDSSLKTVKPPSWWSRLERVNKLISVTPVKTRYNGEIGYKVVGRIVEVCI